MHLTIARVAGLGACTFFTAAAAASAQTITVDAGAPAGCAGTVCSTIAGALAAAADGDLVSVSPGTYAETGLQVAGRVTVRAKAGTVTVKPAGGVGDAAVLTLAATGSALDGLNIAVDGGGTAVAVGATGTTVANAIITRAGATGRDVPLIALRTAGAGALNLRSSTVQDSETRTGTLTTPTILSEPGTALAISDCRIGGGPTAPVAVQFGGGADTARLDRTLVLNQSSTGVAVLVKSAANDPADKSLTADSSVLIGGPGGTALRAVSDTTPPASVAGDIAITLTHVTMPSAARSIVIQALANGAAGLLTPPNPTGSIAVSVRSSIVHGPARVTSNGGGLFQAPNQASLAIVGSDTDIGPGSGIGVTATVIGSTFTPDAKLFAANPDLLFGARLRQDAPVIDRGGSSDSPRDVEGDPRTVGSAPDIGADEFVNRAPTAAIARAPISPRQGQAVIFSASTSADPDEGGGIVSYRWDFGDGQVQTTTTPFVAHAFAELKTYQSRLTVTDGLGASTQSGALSTQVRDGVGPALSIVAPAPRARIKRITTVRKTIKSRVRTTRTRTRIRFAGTTKDLVSGSGPVQIALQLTKAKGLKAPARGRCRYVDPRKRAVVTRSCAAGLLFTVPVRQGVWEYRTAVGTVLLPGQYSVIVRGVDLGGSSTVVTRQFTVT